MNVGAALLGAWQAAAAWTFSAVFLTAATLLALVIPRAAFRRVREWTIRAWARTLLRIMRVRIEVQGGHWLAGRQRRVVTLNHSSLLDAFLALAVLPPGGLPVVKSEILRYPFIGVAARVLDVVTLSRRRARQAVDALRQAAERLVREDLTVMIAPEGTRSRDGAVGTFKRGAFQLAAAARAPVVPMVIVGAGRLQPRGQIHCRGGHVLLKILPPIAPDAWRDPTPSGMARELEEIYRRELAPHEEAA